jgi:hypothetical protein
MGNTIETGDKGSGLEGVDLVYLAQDREGKQAVVMKVMKLLVLRDDEVILKS